MNNYSIYREQKEQSKIANCLVKTLCSLNIFKSDYQNIKIKFFTDNSKHYYLTILGCTNYERNLFVKLIKEIFSPADNQRYLLKKDEKYLIVPDVIGSKKENVLLYVKYLETEFGYFDIIFTRNPEGYKELLKAKYNPYRRLDFKNSRIWM